MKTLTQLSKLFIILAVAILIGSCQKDESIATSELCWQCEVKAIRGDGYVTKRFINYSGFTLEEVKTMTDFYNTDTTLAVYSVMACQ